MLFQKFEYLAEHMGYDWIMESLAVKTVRLI
jgi:hypothetical protein